MNTPRKPVASQSEHPRRGVRSPRGRARSRLGAALAVAMLVAACGGASAPAPQSSDPPAPVLTAAELAAWQTDVDAFVEGFNANALDAEAAFADFTDDAALLDPSSADFRIAPKADVVRQWSEFTTEFPDYSARTTAGYLALQEAAYLTDVRGVPPEMAAVLTDAVLHELRVFRFTQDRVTQATTVELWYRLDDMEALQNGCTPKGCGTQARALVDRYLTAWTRRDPAAITALYRDDATLTDTLLGVQATGATAIADLADVGLGGTGTPTCTARAIYVQTNDGDPATTDNTDPDGGKIAGLAVAYQCTPTPGGTSTSTGTVDSMSILMLGTRPSSDAPISLDPDGLIVSEEVLHNPAGLTTGVAQ